MRDKNFPIWETVEIDINSLCNRDCYFCPRFNDRSGIRKDEFGNKINKKMPTENVYYIIDELSRLRYSGRITFHRLSEPLLDSRYPEFVKYAKEKGMVVVDHTNGDVLRENVELCKLLDGLVDTFVVGLYDYKTGSEREELKEYWLNKFQKTEIKFSTPIEQPEIRINSKIYSETKKNKNIINLPCARRMSGLLIRYDGEVQLCCDDDACEFNLGNVFNQSLEEIWWSKKHIKIINDLQKPMSRHNHKLCSKCYKGYKNYRKSMKPNFSRKLKNEIKSLIRKPRSN